MGAVVGAGLSGAISGVISVYLHIVTTESFDGIGTAFWNGVKWGAIWGAIIGASSVNPQLLAITVTGSLGYSTGQAILALRNSGLPARTKVAVIMLLLLQGVLARASIQRGITAAQDPNYTANANARAVYLDEREQIGRLTQELQRGGRNAEAIGRAVVDLRNALKVRARALMSDSDREQLEARNLELYGDRIGPSYEQLLAKYGSPEAVIEAAVRTNPHIDAMYGPNHFNVPFPPLEDVDQ